MNLYRPHGRSFYHAIFRWKGKLVNRSTGTLDRKEASKKAAEIFAEVVNGPKQEAGYERILSEFSDLKAQLQLALGGQSSVAPARPSYLTPPPATVAGAVDAFFAERKNGNYSHVAEKELEKRMRRFTGKNCNKLQLSDLNPQVVSKWSDKKNDLDAIRQLANWCSKPARKWIPLELVAALPVSQKRKPKTSIFDSLISPGVAEQILRKVEVEHTKYILFYALAIFSGVRAGKEKKRGDDSGEIVRLLNEVKERGWEPLIKNRKLLVPYGKIEDEPRVGFSPECLLAWIAAYPACIEAPLESWHRNHISRPFKVPQNSFRKTCASSFVILYGREKAAEFFGNSQGVLNKHYVSNLIEKADAEALFCIFPKKTDTEAAGVACIAPPCLPP